MKAVLPLAERIVTVSCDLGDVVIDFDLLAVY